MATQGRCKPCRLLFRWQGKPLLRDALCPHCRKPLDRTSQQLQGVPRATDHPLQVVR